MPSRLGGSEFLKDLSTLTGTDLVGSDQSRESLGIADYYTVNLFSSCASADNKIECTINKFGYRFDPIGSLKLDDTGLEGAFSENFLQSISYETAARGIAVAYILALVFSVATLALNLIACIINRTVILGAIVSTLATTFELAAAAASIAVFTNLNQKFNSEFTQHGIKSSLGRNLFIASWMAFGLLFLNSLYLCYNYRRDKQARRRRGGGKSLSSHKILGLNSNGVSGSPKRTKTLELLKNNIPFIGGKHKYAEISKQSGVKSITVTDHDNDREVLVKKGFGGGEDEEDYREEAVRGSTKGIEMQPLGGGQDPKMVDTAYEPFRSVR